MPDQPMTPREAATAVDQMVVGDRAQTETDHRALRVLIDHARATSPAPEGGDLAALADTVRGVRNRLCADELIDEADAELLLDVRIKLDRHRCAPAPSVTTPPQEGEERKAAMRVHGWTFAGDYLMSPHREEWRAREDYWSCPGCSGTFGGHGKGCPRPDRYETEARAVAAPPAEGEAASGEHVELVREALGRYYRHGITQDAVDEAHDARALLAALREATLAPDAAGLLEQAWGVIANASEGRWQDQTSEWQDAATRWRDGWHAHMGIGPGGPPPHRQSTPPPAPSTRPDDEAVLVDAALTLVRAEMLRTIAHRGPLGARLHSEHEGYGVLAEELYQELLPAIHANDRAAQVREAVQVAAVAARWPIDFVPDGASLPDEHASTAGGTRLRDRTAGSLGLTEGCRDDSARPMPGARS